MAGKRLGTVFVELGLDSTEFTKGEAKILRQAQSTSLQMEKNWRTLGSHSDQIFNAMKANITNAYDAIANKSTSSAAEILRAEKAKNEQITRLNEQQFGKQTSLIEKAKANWVELSAAGAAAWLTIGKAMEYVELGAKAQQAEDSFRRVAASSGASADAILANMKRATAGTVDDSDLMQRAVKGMILGLSGDSMTKIAEMARLGARVAGVSVAEAIEGITNAISTGMPKALRQYGLVTKEQMAVVNAALKEGVEGIDLLRIAQINYDIQLARHGALQITVAEQVQIFNASVHETKEFIGNELILVLKGVYDSFRLTAVLALEAASAVMHMQAAYQGYRAAMIIGNKEWSDSWSKAARESQKTALLLSASAEDLKNKVLDSNTAQTESTVSSSGAKIAQLTKERDTLLKQMIEMTKERKDASKIQKDILAEETAANKSHYEDVTSRADGWLRLQKLNGANELNFALDVIGQKQSALNIWYDKQAASINEHVKRESEKQAKLSALDADYNKQWNALENQRKEKAVEVIEFQKKAHSSYVEWDRKQEYDVMQSSRRNAVTRAAISADAWDKIGQYQALTGKKVKADETANIDLMLDEYKDTFAGGVKGALLDISSAHTTWGKTSAEVVKQFAKDSRDELSDNLFKMMHGNFQDLSINWNKLWDGMSRKLSDKISDMMVEAAADQIVMYFKTSWVEGGADVLGIVNKVLGITDTIFGNTGSSSGSGFGGANSSVDVGTETGFAYGGKVQGYVNGRAPYPGDNPGNDIVNAWLSPGEVVIRRSAVNPDTAAILDYINRTAQPPAAYAFGGRVMNQVTDTPGRGYWGFDDWVGVLSGGISYIQKDWDDPRKGWTNFITHWFDNPAGNAVEDFLAYTAPHMFISRILVETGQRSQARHVAAKEYTSQLAHIIGMAAIGGGLSGFSGGAAAGAEEMAKSMAIAYLKKWAIGKLLGLAFNRPETAQMNVDYMGANDGGALGSLRGMMGDIAPSQSRFAFSARNGLDYVPFDNFPANLHKGERVQTAEEADQGRGRQAMTIIVPVTLNGREIARATYKGSRRGQKFIHERGITGV